MKAGKDYGLVFSPERFNPGDTERSMSKIAKLVGAIDKEWAETAKNLYSNVFDNVHIVKDIKTAEASKVIENIQRDLNIALMNELAMIFEKMNIDIMDVINAASTKWNFVKYTPGCGVGGHCLPVDPYYLTEKAKQLGYNAKVIAAGREINDHMPLHTVEIAVKAINSAGLNIKNSKITVLGLTYKGNVYDTRGSPALSIIKELTEYCKNVYVHDPLANGNDVNGLNVKFADFDEAIKNSDCIILVTDHDQFKKLDFNSIKNKVRTPIIIDGRNIFDLNKLREMGFICKGIGRP